MTKGQHYILGFNGSHDGSAAIIKNGKVLGTVTKERITGIKKDSNGNTKDVVESLFRRFGINFNDIDCVAFCDNYIDIDSNYIACTENDHSFSARSNIYGEQRPNHKAVVKYEELIASFQGYNIPCYHINHHLGHHAYSYYTSPFERSLCFSLDGSPGGNSLLSVARLLEIEEYKFPKNNISILYDWFTYFLLGNPLYKAGSLMGLAAFGTPLDKVNEIDLSCEELDYLSIWKSLTDREPKKVTEKNPIIDQEVMDLAATAQKLFEKSIIFYLNSIPEDLIKEYHGQLCLSGGSFLNCQVNGLICKKTLFKKIHIAPACGDDGLAVGAALYCAHHILKISRSTYSDKELAFSGHQYPVAQVGIKYDPKMIAKEIARGKVIGFYQGPSEFGPRALGNRSILADPRSISIKQHLNNNVKKREWFRPFGASVISRESYDWFEIQDNSPFMLMAVNVKKPELIPAVVHQDNSSRIQILTEETNPAFYELISFFNELTGVPLLLNTSLNDDTCPIVETPKDAIDLFYRIPIDILVLEDRVLIKE